MSQSVSLFLGVLFLNFRTDCGLQLGSSSNIIIIIPLNVEKP